LEGLSVCPPAEGICFISVTAAAVNPTRRFVVRDFSYAFITVASGAIQLSMD
jgi:hypothetical protein